MFYRFTGSIVTLPLHIWWLFIALQDFPYLKSEGYLTSECMHWEKEKKLKPLALPRGQCRETLLFLVITLVIRSRGTLRHLL